MNQSGKERNNSIRSYIKKRIRVYEKITQHVKEELVIP